MAKLDDFSAIKRFPEPGTHACVVVGRKKGVSEKKKTPYIELTMSDGSSEFSDQLYVTPGAINRLAIVSKHVCGLPGDTDLPDDKTAAAKFLANYIFENVYGKKCFVVIEQYTEEYIPTQGPDMGRKIELKKRRVAFDGYKKHVAQPEAEKQVEESQEELPF